MGWFSNLFKKSGQDQPSPQGWILKNGLSPYALPFVHDRIIVPLRALVVPLTKSPRVWMPGIVSKSLDPVMDIGHYPILIAGADEADHKKLIDFLKVGDIAVYRFPADMSQPTQVLIEHRILEISKDSKGKYFRFKGDNNSTRDPYIVRDDNIKWVVIGVIYAGKMSSEAD